MTEQNYGLIRDGVGVASLKQCPIPYLPDDYILVKTVAIALNPTDSATLDGPGDNGTLVGCDYAGTVVEVGKDVKRPFKKGDRIAGFSHGGNDTRPTTGAFARYILVKGDIQFHIPDNVSFEAACTVGVALTTLGLGMYKILGLPTPAGQPLESPPIVLIYGGSTATGSVAVQFAKLSGAKVVATTSPKNFDMVKKRGADVVYDYRDTGIGDRIREDTDNQLSLVFDCISKEQTASICAAAIGGSGGKYCNLLGPDCPRSDVVSTFFVGYSASGEEYLLGKKHYPALQDFFDHAVDFAVIAEKLWAEGKWEAHPQRIEPGGLQGALQGLNIMREGRYSAEKLVYRVDETAWP